MSPIFHVCTWMAKATAITQRHTAQATPLLPGGVPERVQPQGHGKTVKPCVNRCGPPRVFDLPADGPEARFTEQRTGCLHLAMINTLFRFSGGLE